MTTTAESQSLVTSTATTRKRPSDVVCNGLLYEFQVFYLVPSGLQSILVREETPSAARWHLEEAGFVVTSIAPGRPLVDWSKPYYSRDELQALVDLSETSISGVIGSGELRKTSVRGLFSVEQIKRWLESHGGNHE